MPTKYSCKDMLTPKPRAWRVLVAVAITAAFLAAGSLSWSNVGSSTPTTPLPSAAISRHIAADAAVIPRPPQVDWQHSDHRGIRAGVPVLISTSPAGGSQASRRLARSGPPCRTNCPTYVLRRSLLRHRGPPAPTIA